MMDQIVFNKPEDGMAIALRAGAEYGQHSVSVCRVKDGQRLGGVLYTNYTGESISMHTASWTPRWVNRDLIYVAFDYPFNQLGVKRIFGLVPEDNQQAQRLNAHIGLKVIARIEGVFRNNVACLVMRLEREDCRHLNIKPRNIKRNNRIH